MNTTHQITAYQARQHQTCTVSGPGRQFNGRRKNRIDRRCLVLIVLHPGTKSSNYLDFKVNFMHPDVDFPLAANSMTFNSFVSTYTLAHPGLRSLGNSMHDNNCPDFSPLTWLMFGTPQGTILGPLVFNPFCDINIAMCCDF